MLHELAQQHNQTLSLRVRQVAPVDQSVADHAGDPAISQAPTTPYNQVLETFATLSKILLQRFQ
jgi:CRISPR/Cas system endoribonuclease Cas6 (RAMP superfamily)